MVMRFASGPGMLTKPPFAASSSRRFCLRISSASRLSVVLVDAVMIRSAIHASPF